MHREVYPVQQVSRYLRELLETNPHLTDIWVAGEVSNLSLASSGHIYFTLKDGQAALRCAFFRSRNIGQRERLAAGTAVVVHGSFSLYELRGDLSFVIDFVQPEGTGALAAEFERLRAGLAAEGLFAAERKRPLPRFPERIGVVTSAAGAVFHDIADVLGRRWPLAELWLQPTPVQGAEAAPAVAEAVRVLASRAPELLIVARGGGSAEDLWAFNAEPVVRAIYASPVPVVSAVGHETDHTLADLVADVSAPTPSAAAELVAPDRAEVLHRVESLHTGAELGLARRLAAAYEAVDQRAAALHRGGSAAMALAEERTAALAARLRTLSPLATLERGYAIVERADGTPVVAAAELAAGDGVTLRLRDGTRPARIEPGP